MKISILSDVSGHGGAAMIANGLNIEWSKSDEVARRYIIRHSGDANPDLAIPRNRLLNYALHNPSKRYIGPLARMVTRSLVSSELEALKPDVISIHNIHASAESHELVASCVKIAPVVWTLHDMWSFTGRCAHSSGCDKFVRGCDSDCPTPYVRPALHPSKIARAWHDRQRFFESTPNLVGVSPSNWLASIAKMGLWKKHRIEVIHNGVDLEVFRPRPRDSVRDSLGLPRDALVLTAYVGHKGDPFKTPELLEDALNYVTTPVHILAFGPGILSLPSRHKVINLGSINNQRFLSIAYSCGDIFVLSSAQENFPTVILEAAACGVPTVAFDVGGNSEIVKEGVTGWLSDSMTAKGLAEKISLGLHSAHYSNQIQQACRSFSEINFNVTKQADLYKNLFNEIVSVN